MNKLFILALLGSIGLSVGVKGQTEGSAGAPSGRTSFGGPGGDKDRPSFRHFGSNSTNESEYVDRWLASLKEKNPQEFERLAKLRQENPEEFRHHLHQRLQELRTKGGMPGGSLRDHPAIVEALKDLPAEDREWAMQRLQMMTGRGDGNPQRGDGFPDFKRGNSPEMQRDEEKSRELTKKWREARTDAERAEIKAELRATYSALFDHREKTRAESFKQMEEMLGKLRQQLQERQQSRDKLIDARLEESLRGPAEQR